MRPIPGQSKKTQNKGMEPDILEAALWGDADNSELLSLARRGRTADEKNLVVRLAVEMMIARSFASDPARSRTVEVSVNFKKQDDKIEDGDPTDDPKIGAFVEPFILGYGAGRHMGVRNTEVTATDPLDSLFGVASELFDADELLGRLDYGRLMEKTGQKRVAKKAGEQLLRMKELLATLLPELKSAHDIVIVGPKIPGQPSGRAGVHLRTPDGLIPLNEVSLGYQTMAAWVIDIAWRMFERFPDSANPFKEHAIILVDEIDLHLHPKWQRRMRDDMTGHFPNVQFIATAHSPLMAQSALDANLVVLKREEEDRVVIDDEPVIVQDWRLDQIVTSELFGLPTARPPEIETLLVEQARINRKVRLTKADKALLFTISDRLSALDTAETAQDRQAMDIVRRAAEVLKKADTA